ncbi:MAG TPA: hypothetical protein DDW49_01825 [Deltaproteobacteria bacterium]|nr:MAG: hypothetical protein A2048_06955 [Deltaproteobacteria bacterium GWA2_45_12]HBF12122.1 hypothetical protein [Deltaproteobacteria bacterium]
METARKITILLPEDLLHKAQKVTQEGITPTIRKGLELLAASKFYENLLKRRGTYKFGISLKQLREDRDV